jgi:hypothetical protein
MGLGITQKPAIYQRTPNLNIFRKIQKQPIRT